jgi:predicted enzyme related to lactoylglutathione lyase
MTDARPAAFGLVLDCADPARLAEFWSAALGYSNAGAAGAYVALSPTAGSGPKLLLQRVADPKATKNRMHLDIEAVDIEREAERLVGLGAQRMNDDIFSEHGSNWILMADPEGNEFCVCDHGSSAAHERTRDRDGDGRAGHLETSPHEQASGAAAQPHVSALGW